MKNVNPSYACSGIYYTRRKVLKFNNYNELISEKDTVNLFTGLCRLISKNSERKMEMKYLQKIEFLEKQINRLSRGKNN